MDVHPKTLLLSPISVCRQDREVNITVIEHSTSFESEASSVSQASTTSSVEVQVTKRSIPQKDHRFFASKSRTGTCRTMTRTRTADRLVAAGNRSAQKNRSEELDGLRQKFDTFSKQFKPFGTALKHYHASLVTLEQNRSEVLQHIEIFTKGTPLFDTTGKGNKVVVAAPSWAKSYAKKPVTYCSMERQISSLNTAYAQQTEEYCLAYLKEWEIVVSTRIQSGLAKADELHKNWQHYEKKVQHLNELDAKLGDRGKSPDDKQKDKLTRNESKLDIAQQEYDKYATSLCHVIDSALDCAWQDMTPLLYRLVNMEYDRMGGKDANTLTESLQVLIGKLKKFAREHKIDLSAPEQAAKSRPERAKSPLRAKSPTRLTPKRLWSKDA